MALLAAGLALPLDAHVEILPPSVPADAFFNISVVAYHGCDEHATTRITLRIPESVGIVRPKVKPGWRIETRTIEYAEPFEVFGTTYAEGVSEITWSGGSIPAEQMDDFTLSGYFRGQDQETARFHVEQECAGVEEPLTFAPSVRLRGQPTATAATSQVVPAADREPAAAAAAAPPYALALSGIAVLISLVALAAAFRR
ncbi:MAG TPA: DUF1775 domain-containing protein [Thermoanaerobaculia bacterium]|nr:DUF1775 domain-containing protein [Thermoanaerobaculia bacterium]